jgi:hypothetical protein
MSKIEFTFVGSRQFGILDEVARHAEDAIVNVQHIRARLRESFRPFAVVMSSGNKYPVPHPDFIFLTDRVVVVADQRGYTANLDPLHIVGLADTPVRGNGGRKPRKKR